MEQHRRNRASLSGANQPSKKTRKEKEPPRAIASDWGNPEQYRQSDTRGFDYRGYEDFEHLETYHSSEGPEEWERWGMMRGYENEDPQTHHGRENFRPSENDPRFVSTSSTDERRSHDAPRAHTNPKSSQKDDKAKSDEPLNEDSSAAGLKQNPSH